MSKDKQNLNSSESNGLDFNLKSRYIDLTKEIPDPIPVLSINDILIGSPGNILTIKATQKAGKSFVVSMIAAAYLKGECLNFRGKPIEGKPKIQYLDTEQSEPYVYRVGRRIHKLAGLDPQTNDPRLQIAYLKEETTDNKHKALAMAASDPEVGLIILDGIIDIIHDFNDLRESTALRDYILKIVGEKDLILVNVIHTNKKDANSRGHIGSFLEQKSESVITVKKEGEAHKIEPAYSRDKDSEPFHFSINDKTGLPELYDATETQAETKENKIRNNMEHCLTKGPVTYKKLVIEYSEISGYAEVTAKKHIGEALKKGIVQKDEKGNYSLYSIFSNDEDPF